MRAISLGLVLAFLAAPALAQSGYGSAPPPQQPTPMAMQGTIVSVAGDVMTVKGGDGQSVAVNMTAQTGVSAHAKRTLSDIRQGSFVGSAAVPGPDGRLYAQEVHIFPEAMRGTYEGHHPMPGGAADRTMTNAAVTGVAVLVLDAREPGMPHSPPSDRDSWVLLLKHAGGENEIVVEPEVPVFAIVPGDKTWLKPGLAVSFFGQKAPDGTVTAFGVFVERDGQKPMM
jgi:hypothetical protein